MNDFDRLAERLNAIDPALFGWDGGTLAVSTAALCDVETNGFGAYNDNGRWLRLDADGESRTRGPIVAQRLNEAIERHEPVKATAFRTNANQIFQKALRLAKKSERNPLRFV